MRINSVHFILLVVELLPLALFGDGKVFPPTAYPDVQIPDQRALIHFADGMETLVIETSFVGQGTNFAWVVPIPSVPKIEEASTGLFPTLQTIFQPKVIHNITRYYLSLIIVGALVVMWRRLRSQSYSLPTALLISLTIGLSVGLLMGPSLGAIMLLYVPIVSWRLRGSNATLFNFIPAILTPVILLSMLLPALGSAGVSVGGSSGVNVLERKIVGVYETATISSPDADALVKWLQKNGFKLAPGITPVISDYAKGGWVFVAAKLSRDAGATSTAQAHPLAFTFKTGVAVYPLRLTGVGNDSCRIDLYVFGPNRAGIPNFKVERCEQPVYPAGGTQHFRPDDTLRIRHPGLKKFVEEAPVATKLSGNLTTADMQKDAYVAWAPFNREQQTFYSFSGAGTIAANTVASLLLFGWLGVGFIARNRDASAIVSRPWHTMVVVASLACGTLTFLVLPKVKVNLVHLSGPMTRHVHQQMAILTRFRVEDLTEENKKPTNAAAESLRMYVRTNLVSNTNFWRKNYLIGGMVREEDSPGNYTIGQTEEDFEYIWYDIDGAPQMVPLSELRGTPKK